MEKRSILFIGNSYTFTHDLPNMLQQIADSDPSKTLQIETEMLARGGARLSEYLKDGSAVRAIRKRRYDIVVLQPHSLWAMQQWSIDKTVSVASELAHEICKSGAKPLLFLTWARRQGSDWYPETAGVELRDAPFMQSRIDKAGHLVARKIGSDVIPAGDCWMDVEKNDRSLNLYDEDNWHPSPCGTYLNALLFFNYLSGISPKQIGFTPREILSEDAEKLRVYADEFVVKRPLRANLSIAPAKRLVRGLKH